MCSNVLIRICIQIEIFLAVFGLNSPAAGGQKVEVQYVQTFIAVS